MDSKEKERAAGAFIGLAVGDALGAALEFKRPGSFEPVDDMIGGGPFGLKPGQWTDDTSMAICLAESLIEAGGFNAHDQMQRYRRWYEEGYGSSTGFCFDIDVSTHEAIVEFKRSDDPWAGPTHELAGGTGSLVRVAPVPMHFRNDPVRAIKLAGESSRTTHAAPVAIAGCRYLAGLLVGAIEGRPKEELLSDHFHPVTGRWDAADLTPEIVQVTAGSYRDREPPAIVGSDRVPGALEAVLWAFSRSNDFRSGALMAVNLGDDSDTIGAIFGQLAGAFYGLENIPAEWRERITMSEKLHQIAHRLLD